MSPSCAAPILTPGSPRSTSTAAKAADGVIAVVTGDELARGLQALADAARAAARARLAAATSARPRGSVLAGRSRRRRRRGEPRAGGRCGRADRDRLGRIARDRDDGDAPAAPAAPTVHSAMASNNLGLDHAFSVGDLDAAFRDAAVVVEHEFTFERQTGVTLEPRRSWPSSIAGSRAADRAPFASGALPDAAKSSPRSSACRCTNVRVVTPDVGGAFGMKLSAYPDEMAVVALAVHARSAGASSVADRLKSFVSDIHAREAKVHGRLAVRRRRDGLVAMEVSVLSGLRRLCQLSARQRRRSLAGRPHVGCAYRLPNFRGARARLFPEQVADRRAARRSDSRSPAR